MEALKASIKMTGKSEPANQRKKRRSLSEKLAKHASIHLSALHSDPRDEGPVRPGLEHEVKHEGFRLIVQREGDRVRLFSRNGHDWSDRYPWIVDAARRLRQKQFVIDGEAVILGVDGISDFAALFSPP